MDDTKGARGDLVTVTDRLGNTTTFEYYSPDGGGAGEGPAHYMYSVTDALGRTSANTIFDSDGRIEELSDAHGKTVQMDYDLVNLELTITDQVDNSTVVSLPWMALIK